MDGAEDITRRDLVKISTLIYKFVNLFIHCPRKCWNKSWYYLNHISTMKVVVCAWLPPLSILFLSLLPFTSWWRGGAAAHVSAALLCWSLMFRNALVFECTDVPVWCSCLNIFDLTRSQVTQLYMSSSLNEVWLRICLRLSPFPPDNLTFMDIIAFMKPIISAFICKFMIRKHLSCQ